MTRACYELREVLGLGTEFCPSDCPLSRGPAKPVPCNRMLEPGAEARVFDADRGRGAIGFTRRRHPPPSVPGRWPTYERTTTPDVLTLLTRARLGFAGDEGY